MSTSDFSQAANDTKTVASAEKLARILHAHQKDHSGHPYILHPARVVNNVRLICPDADTDLLCAAWLHDVLEDCEITSDELLTMGYSPATVEMIKAVTKPKDDDRPYPVVIQDLLKTNNRGAILIKIADNMDNLHPERVAEFAAKNPEKSARLVKRYTASVELLATVLGLDRKTILGHIASAPALNLPKPEPA
jgi:(p)ppGpp synthase/HD superfamily hydrolase